MEDIGLCSRSPDDATERTAEEAMDVVETAYARFASLKSLQYLAAPAVV
jgi:hypothetical protein